MTSDLKLNGIHGDQHEDPYEGLTNETADTVANDPIGEELFTFPSEDEMLSNLESWQVKPAFSSVQIEDCKGGHEKRVTSVEWSTYGNWLASSSEDRSVCLWSFDESRDPTVSSTFSGHRDYVERVRWDPTCETTLATGSLDKTVCLWDIRSGRQTATVEVGDPCVNVQWSPDGNSIVTLLELDGNGGGSVINIIDVRAVSRNYHPRRIRYPETIQDLAFSSCGEYLFLASSHGIPSNANGYGVIEVVGFRPHPEPKQSALRKLHTLEGHSSPASAIAMSPTGDLFASGDEDALVEVWGLSNLECIAASDCFCGPLLSLSFSHDGAYLAAAMEEESLAVLDVVQNKLVYKEEKMLTAASADTDATYDKTVVSCVDWHPSKLALAASLDTGRGSITGSSPCIRIITFGDPIQYSDENDEDMDEIEGFSTQIYHRYSDEEVGFYMEENEDSDSGSDCFVRGERSEASMDIK